MILAVSQLFAQSKVTDLPYLESNGLNRNAEYSWKIKIDENKPLILSNKKAYYKELVFIDEHNAIIIEYYPVNNEKISTFVNLQYPLFEKKVNEVEYVTKQKYIKRQRFIVLINKMDKNERIFKAEEDEYEIWSLIDTKSKEKYIQNKHINYQKDGN
ncbi:hypothetical protein EG359_01000 [Chryseobacterium joostei]|uniref:Uncharacterized protein n=1 Tax=Chryseobacterium joostei TaxID=112234 RepID=A0A1N7IS48_9FLAO|nr:hypothetical protein [Chryseobacterium joostei]AZA98264.1 hypothetical protein EG359_01000 [Chryseobacterium joostei]SIS39913.1 hypothetical protein SAMN05421768_106329 [Chryseobacterium joostei]